MLTYTPPAPSAPAVPGSRQWILLLVFVWLWPGVFNHDLWSPGEPELFAVVSGWVAHPTVFPELFGKPALEVSPLYVWLGALFHRFFASGPADGYETVRLVSVFLTVTAFFCTGAAARQFVGRRQGRVAVLVLIGCPGLLVPAHMISDISVWLLGSALCWYGWSLCRTRVMAACLMLGAGWIVLSLTGSLMLPFAVLCVAVLLPLHPLWRFRRFGIVTAGAFLWALPLMAAWPFAVYRHDPEAFRLWWDTAALYPFGGFDNFHASFSFGYYLKNLLWFAFPAWALALWTAYKTRLLQTSYGVLLAVWTGVMLTVLGFSKVDYQDLLVVLLPGAAVVATVSLDALRRGAVAFLNWFGIMAFGFFSLFLWLGFFAMNYGWPAKLAERAVYFSPYYRSDFDYFPLLVACLLTPLWIWAVTRRHIRGRQAVTNWAAGVLLVWSLLLTLFLPWLDAAKSFRPVVQQMQHVFDEQEVAALQSGSLCVSADASDTVTRIAWAQYGWVVLHPDDKACSLRLVRQLPYATDLPGWTTRWKGARPREKHYIFALRQRIPVPAATRSHTE